MEDSAYQFRIDLTARGYFGAPPLAPGLEPPRDPRDAPWRYCALAFDRAKRGDFSLLPGLLDVHGRSADTALESMCTLLLAVAGPARCFPRIVDIVKTSRRVDDVLGYGGALAVRGELSYVPVLLDWYAENRGNRDAIRVLDFVSDLVGETEHVPDSEDFPDEAMSRYQEMLARFGNDKVLVYLGEEYSVLRVAQLALEHAQQPHFRLQWRADFEAATGMDCSSWYRDGAVRPLGVAAVIESFLQSPGASGYRPGVRYFFGHRIPD